jgi:hypothetical protein
MTRRAPQKTCTRAPQTSRSCSAETDVDCGGKDCNPCDLKKGCLKGPDCKSGFCVKPDPNVAGSCGSCAKDEDCGETPGTYCKGGTCVKKKDNGDACAGSNECGSGNCPKQDGVCCETACEGSCVSCLNAKTGILATGKCGPVKMDTDPDKECSDMGAQSCGSNGKGCNGIKDASACKLYDNKTQCAPAQCKEGKETAALSCDGKGMCVKTQPTSCAPYTCDSAGMACLKMCTKDAECTDDHYCDTQAKTCKAKKGLGDGCTGGNQCKTGNCPTMDGVCCDKPCNGTCESCLGAQSVGGKNGECSAVKANTDPANECNELLKPNCNGLGSCG